MVEFHLIWKDLDSICNMVEFDLKKVELDSKKVELDMKKVEFEV